MKKSIFVMVLVFTITTLAQNAIEHPEGFLTAPITSEMMIQKDGKSFTVKEKFRREFSRDPIAFQKRNFNILEYIDKYRKKNFDTYYVNFLSPNGRLEVQYNKRGEILMHRQWFVDVEIPREILDHLQNNYKGWMMTKNRYFSKGTKDITQKTVYRIKLNKGDKTQKVKIRPNLQQKIRMAKN